MLRAVPELMVLEHKALKQMTVSKREKVTWEWKNKLYGKKFTIGSLHQMLLTLILLTWRIW
jgi:hypothetical protein